MKIAYLLGSLSRGGTETLLLDVFRNADKAMFPFIGIHRKGGPYMEDFYKSGPRMVRCTPKRFGILRYLWSLRKILLQENITIAHAQQSLDCVYAKLAAIGTGIRIVETFHGYDLKANRFDKFINALSIWCADTICFVSQAQRDHYSKAYNIPISKSRVVYNGVDFSKIDSAKPSLEFANQPQRIRLAMVGNFVSGRSQNIIAKSIHLLRQKGVTDFEFYFIGGKSEREPWRYDECVKYCVDNKLNNVHFLGSRGDVPSLLKSIDAFVYSTEHDTFGIAVVEAMATGLPVVVNDWDVIKEITHNGEWAMLYKTDDSEDCALSIYNLLQRLPAIKKHAHMTANIVRDAYSIETHILRLSEVYALV